MTRWFSSSEDDAEHMIGLKGEVDVLGVQDWDGKGNVHIYVNAFLFATAQSKIFYAYADTPMDKERWVQGIHMAVTQELSKEEEEKAQEVLMMSPITTTTSTTSTEMAEVQIDCRLCKTNVMLGRNRCYSCENYFFYGFIDMANDMAYRTISYFWEKREKICFGRFLFPVLTEGD